MAAVVTDPFSEQAGLTLPKLKADIVTRSHAAVDGAVQTTGRELSGPGEYEIGGVFITGIATKGKERNTIFRFNFGGLTVVHAGRLNRMPSQTQIEALGEVNVLLLPVGGEGTLNGVQAAELVAMIEPGIVVPMQFGPEGVEKFLNEMGSADLEPTASLRVSGSSVPEETQTVLLEAKS